MNVFYSILIYPIAQIIEFIFVFSENLFKTTGFSIISVSIVTNIICIPLYFYAERLQNNERKIQKIMTPQISKIKSVFKGDEQYMILSAYYRQNKYHPIFALRSVFGVLFQIPFFIAAYSFFSNLELLNDLPFLFIKNLSKPDSFLQILNGINILPIIMTVINIISSSIYANKYSIKEKIQLYSISILFLILLYNSPSGLVLYWTTNNIFSLVKNIFVNIKIKNKNYILKSAITILSILISCYTLFILQDSPKTRILISIFFIILGLFPWTISFFVNTFKKVKHYKFSTNDLLIILFTSLLVLWFIAGLFIPSMLVSSSPQEFSYIDDINNPLYFIMNTALQAFGLFILWPLILFFLFSYNIKHSITLLLLLLSYLSLINVFIFSGNYGPISSDLVFTEASVDHDTIDIYLNFFIIILVSILLTILFIRGFKKQLLLINTIIIISLFTLSFKNIIFINKEFKKLSDYYVVENKTASKITPIFDLSKNGRNVIIIMLDMAESVFLPFILDEDNTLYSKYDGFVYYPNTVTFNGWTKGGAPPLFGGYEYTPIELNNRKNVTFIEKTNESLLILPRLFSKANFSVTITDPPYADDNWIPDLRIYDNERNVKSYLTDGVYTDLWLNKNDIVLQKQSKVLERNFLWYSFFRQSPLLFRKEIYYTGSWCAPFSNHRMRLFINGFAVLDFLNDLVGYNDSDKGSLLLMVNNTTHEPLFLQAPEYRPILNVTNFGKGPFNKETRFHINSSAILCITNFFDYLKSNDLYDNTRIILVSDHGCMHATYVTKTNLPFHVDQYNPLLLVKDFNSRGEMKTDMGFMTNADVPSIAMKGIIENPINPFTGKSITQEKKKESQLILVDRVRLKNENEIIINQKNSYYVKDNLFEISNWSKPDNLE